MRRAIFALAAATVCIAVSPVERSAERPLSRIAFGSCLGQDLPQPIWKQVLAAKPEVFDWDRTDRPVRIKIVDVDGDLVLHRKIDLSTLREGNLEWWLGEK